MNEAFGSGQIIDVRLHVAECDEQGIYGRAITQEGKESFFRLENGIVTFLSRKRKLSHAEKEAD
jgi:hypothetical protein